MSQDYIDKLGIAPSECACERCQSMCQAPCTGSVEDMERLIDAGYADRLMFDDLPSKGHPPDILKPALKGVEGGPAPWQTSSSEGCTFWKGGKCELHDLGLKPTLGRLAYHGKNDFYDKYAKISSEDWATERAFDLIERWKKLVNYNPDANWE